MRQDYTDITVVLDRSGSMASIKEEMEGGFTRFVNSQRELPGTCRVTMVHFDGTSTDVRYTARPIREIGPLGLVPRGNTPLLDAAAFSIRLTGDRLAASPEVERPGNVLLVIITDGQENASRTTTAAELKSMIEHQCSAYKWDFIYLGANVNAFAEAQRMGIPVANAANYEADSEGVGESFDILGAKLLRYRSGDKAAVAFTPGERQRMKR